MRHQEKGEIVTGLLYIDEGRKDLHDANQTVAAPLSTYPAQDLCPGSAALDGLMKRYR
jgi:2-oxoglutarate ferredoxin oxidoreductase subunit beta